MYSSLHKIDIVAQHDDRRLLVQTDHRTTQEIDEEGPISPLFALARVLNAHSLRDEEEAAPLVRYAMMDEPTEALRAAVVAAGGQLEVLGQVVEAEASPASASTEALAEEHFGALARRVAEGRGATGEPTRETLQEMETEILVDRGRFELEEDEILHWTTVLELAAVTGELVRQELGGGRWRLDPQDMSTVPFCFEAPDGRLYNVIGKAERFLREGISQRPSRLVEMASEDLETAARIMPSLKPRSWAEQNNVLFRALLDHDEAAEESTVPVITFGEDRPLTFATIGTTPERLAELDELHTRALQNVAREEVEVEVFDVEGLEMAAVTGTYFAGEKLLDRAFMEEMHQRFESPMLLAGVPRKGTLLLCDAAQDPELIQNFLVILIGEFSNQDRDGAPLSPTPLVVSEGEVVGLVKFGPSAN